METITEKWKILQIFWVKEYNLSQFEFWNINNLKIKWEFWKLHLLSLCLAHASWGQDLDGLWLKSSTSRSQDTEKPHLFTLRLHPKIRPKLGALKLLMIWNFWEHFLMNAVEHVAPKTKPVCSELQIPRPAAVLKESRCTCFSAECISDVPVYFWPDLLPGLVSVSGNRDQIPQHSESVFYILAVSKKKKNVDWVEFAPLCFR